MLEEKNIWKPKNHYSLCLKDIQEQLTPAEEYRHHLVTAGKIERMLRRLEWRWGKNPSKWTRAAMKVQSLHRGRMGRLVFKVLRPQLILKQEQRVAKAAVLEASQRGENMEALQILKGVREMNCELIIYESKLSYSLGMFHESEQAARRAIELDATSMDAKYLICCALVNKQKMNEAFEELTGGINTDSWPPSLRTRIYQLRAFAATRMTPPQFQRAVLDFDILIAEAPHDNNLYLQRACAYCGLQDWTKALSDLAHILYFQPKLAHVLAIRARVLCCRREWKKAREDYRGILERNPHDGVALRGLQECSEPPPKHEFPMIDPDMIE